MRAVAATAAVRAVAARAVAARAAEGMVGVGRVGVAMGEVRVVGRAAVTAAVGWVGVTVAGRAEGTVAVATVVGRVVVQAGRAGRVVRNTMEVDRPRSLACGRRLLEQSATCRCSR